MTVIVDTLQAELRRLHELRIKSEHAATTVRDRRAEWEEQNSEMLARATVLSRAVAECEKQVRTLAVMATELTGDKKPAAGVEVRASLKVTVQDATAALEWARASRIGYVPEGIDAKVIEQAASKADLQLPFLRSETAFKALIATDLGKALAQAEPAAEPLPLVDLGVPEAA